MENTKTLVKYLRYAGLGSGLARIAFAALLALNLLLSGINAGAAWVTDASARAGDKTANAILYVTNAAQRFAGWQAPQPQQNAIDSAPMIKKPQAARKQAKLTALEAVQEAELQAFIAK